MYNLAYIQNLPWVVFVKNILDDCGLSYLWTTQQMYSVAWVKHTVKRILLDQDISKCKQHSLSIDCQLDMFDRVIQPILLYGCEVWGFTKNTLIEKLHMKYCKYIMHLNNKTPNFMVYGELGRFPLIINIKIRMVTFWAKLHFSSNMNKLATKMYNLAYIQNLPWVVFVKNILDDCGLSYLWTTQQMYSVAWVKHTVKRILLDQNMQLWKSNILIHQKVLIIEFSRNPLS